MEVLYEDARVQLLGKDSIRHVSIQPGELEDPIKLSLDAVPSLDNATYEALSYVWGPSRSGRTVQVNNCLEIKVTDKLFNALRRLRNAPRKRWQRNAIWTVIWIDQICINQASNEAALKERSKQLQMMDKIYAGAICVNVWLGESRYDTRQWLKTIIYPRARNTNGFRKWENAKERRMIRKTPEYRCTFDGVPWHSRMWTIQEFVVARMVYFCWGDARVQYELRDHSNDYAFWKDAGLGQLQEMGISMTTLHRPARQRSINKGRPDSREEDFKSLFSSLRVNGTSPRCADEREIWR